MLFVSQENRDSIEKSFYKRFPDFPPLWRKEIGEAMDRYTSEEKICMQFLLAFMPDQDVCAYPLPLFEKYMRFALHMRTQAPWGRDIQDDLFLNYVLQYRVNNEDVQFCLDRFAEELWPRVRRLDIESAVIEVNCWCYEKAVYQSTDLRTISPAGIVKRAYGRCGEESSFCVAAMRSVGIPARQVYTPRWAHCDDNHAWVEVYANGKWRFLGACEPEPALDSGWFKAPASRAMLVHSKVFSTLAGQEHYSVKTAQSLELNLLDHYARTRTIHIRLLNKEGEPVSGAFVHFQLVNFAELYTINTCRSDAEGMVGFTTGAGDLIVHCHHEGLWGFAKINAAEETRFTITLGNRREKNIMSLKLVPPAGESFEENIRDNAAKERHKARLETHAAAREARIKAFYSPEKAREWAQQLPEFREEAAAFLEHARGNHGEIISFLTIEETVLPLALRAGLLNTFAPKDFVDITCETLVSFARHGLPYRQEYPDDVFCNYLLNPRIEYEMITDHRKSVADFFSTEEKTAFRNSPDAIHTYIQSHIQDSEETRYSIFYSSPIGALQYRKANHLTKRMLFVAICRSLGIPARIEKKDKSLCFYKNSRWHTIKEQKPDESANKGSLILLRDESEGTLEYLKDFTIGIFRKSDYETLDLRQIPWEGKRMSLTLEAGDYRIITASRKDDGSLLCSFCFAEILPGSVVQQSIGLSRSGEECEQVQFDELVLDSHGTEVPLSSLLTGRMNVLAYLGAGDEPTEHLLNEIIEAGDQFAALETPFIFLVDSQKALENKSFKRALACFSHARVLAVNNTEAIKAQFRQTRTQDANLPLIATIDRERKVQKAWSGYNVGIGSLIIKRLSLG